MNMFPRSIHLALVASASLMPLVQAATEAITEPVGFIAITATGGSLSAPKLSLISPTLLHTVDWQGSIETLSSNATGPTTLTVVGTPWVANQFNGANGSYFVEVISATSPSNSGALGDITANAEGALTVSDNLSSFAATGDTIKIRRHVTIGDFLGVNNTYGLLATDDASTADEVLIYDGASVASYFYYTGSPGFSAGWYDSHTFASATNQIIAPNEGVVIKRKGAGSVTIVSSGAVKLGNTLTPVVTGLNVLGTVSAMGLTLGNSGLFTGSNNSGIKPSDDASTADELTIYGSATQKNYFYYIGSPGFPSGWYDSNTFASATSVSIPPGSAFVLRRKGGSSFNWALPSPSSY